MERIRSDRILTQNGVQAGYVYFENGRTAAVTAQELPFEREWDRTGMIVSPGFVELHTHGGAGHDFLGSAADIVAGCNFHLMHGATTVCPSLSAAPFDRMRQAVLEAKQAQRDPALLPNLPGVHMEGPYLSPEQCGAQCVEFMSDPVPEQYEGLLARRGTRWRGGRMRRSATRTGASAGTCASMAYCPRRGTPTRCTATCAWRSKTAAGW